jgi:hypothetical protein
MLHNLEVLMFLEIFSSNIRFEVWLPTKFEARSERFDKQLFDLWFWRSIAFS